MIVKLYLYFGSVGIASILAWLGALAMLVNYARHERRTFFYTRALILALAGLLLAQVNSFNVSRIEVDRRQELKADRERLLRAQQAGGDDKMKSKTAGLRFAEDGREDALAGAASPVKPGAAPADKRSIYEQAADGNTPKTPEKKQESKPPKDAPKNSFRAGTAGATAWEESAEPGRVKLLPAHDRDRACRLDKLNRWIADFIIGLAVFLLVLDYFLRFNRTFGTLLPLPFAGRIIDSLFPKKHSVVLRAGKPGLAPAYLETVVRKGEAFIYCGDNLVISAPSVNRLVLPLRDIWQGALAVLRPNALLQLTDRLGKVSVRGRPLATRWHRPQSPAMVRTGLAAIRRWTKTILRWVARLYRRIVAPFRGLFRKVIALAWVRRVAGAAWPPLARNIRRLADYLYRKGRPCRQLIAQFRNGIIEYLPVQVIDINSDPRIVSPDFVYECAWFNRYCFMVQGPERAAALFAGFRQFVISRLPPRACAWKTINLLWDSRTPLSPDLVRQLAAFSKDVNFKLVVFAADSQIAEVGKWMEEICPDEPKPGRRPTPAAELTNWVLRNFKKQ